MEQPDCHQATHDLRSLPKKRLFFFPFSFYTPKSRKRPLPQRNSSRSSTQAARYGRQRYKKEQGQSGTDYKCKTVQIIDSFARWLNEIRTESLSWAFAIIQKLYDGLPARLGFFFFSTATHFCPSSSAPTALNCMNYY